MYIWQIPSSSCSTNEEISQTKHQTLQWETCSVPVSEQDTNSTCSFLTKHQILTARQQIAPCSKTQVKNASEYFWPNTRLCNRKLGSIRCLEKPRSSTNLNKSELNPCFYLQPHKGFRAKTFKDQRHIINIFCFQQWFETAKNNLTYLLSQGQ